MKIWLLTTLVILLGAAVLLAATNPTTEEYSEFLETSLAKALERMGEDSIQETAHEKQMIRDLLKSQGKQVIHALSRSNTIRRNYGFFSIFETSALGVRIEVVGVAHRFFPREDEQEIVKKLGRLIM
jgi:hypothetical protein